jgi:hypothetical protein
MMKRRGIGKRVAAGVLAVMLALGTTPADLSGIFANIGIVAQAATAADASYITTSSGEGDETTTAKVAEFGESGIVTATWNASGEKLAYSNGTETTVIQNSNGDGKKTGTYTSSSGVLYIDTTTDGKFEPNKEDGENAKNGYRIQVNSGTQIYVPTLGHKTVTTITFTTGSYSGAKKNGAVKNIGEGSDFRYSSVEWDDSTYSCVVTSYTKSDAANIEIIFNSDVYLKSITSTSYSDALLANYGSNQYSEEGVVTATWETGDSVDKIKETSNGAYKSKEGDGVIYVDASATGAKFEKHTDASWTAVNAGTVIFLPISGYKTVTEIEYYDKNATSVFSDVEALKKAGTQYVSTGVESTFEGHSGRVSAVITTYGDGEASELALVLNNNGYIGNIKSTSYNATATISGSVSMDGGSDLPDGLEVEVSFKATGDGDEVIKRTGAVEVSQDNKTTGTYSVNCAI